MGEQVAGDRIPTTFNVFMNVEVAPDGKVKVMPRDHARVTRSISARKKISWSG